MPTICHQSPVSHPGWMYLDLYGHKHVSTVKQDTPHRLNITLIQDGIVVYLACRLHPADREIMLALWSTVKTPGPCSCSVLICGRIKYGMSILLVNMKASRLSTYGTCAVIHLSIQRPTSSTPGILLVYRAWHHMTVTKVHGPRLLIV